jgi:hypothetical protein
MKKKAEKGTFFIGPNSSEHVQFGARLALARSNFRAERGENTEQIGHARTIFGIVGHVPARVGDGPRDLAPDHVRRIVEQDPGISNGVRLGHLGQRVAQRPHAGDSWIDDTERRL